MHLQQCGAKAADLTKAVGALKLLLNYYQIQWGSTCAPTQARPRRTPQLVSRAEKKIAKKEKKCSGAPWKARFFLCSCAETHALKEGQCLF